MSNAGKKKGGIGSFWDTVAPPAEETPPPSPERPAAPQVDAAAPVKAPAARKAPASAPQVAPPSRPRGRPSTGVVKERMTVNLSPRSLRILESLRYQARIGGRRSASFSDLLDEAVGLLAKHYGLSLKD